MKRKQIVLCVLGMLVLCVQHLKLSAQTQNPPPKEWEYNENVFSKEDWLYDVIQTSDGTYVSCGYAEKTITFTKLGVVNTVVGQQGMIIKSDAYGHRLWEKDIAAANKIIEPGGSLSQDPNGEDVDCRLWQIVEVNDSRGHLYIAAGSKFYPTDYPVSAGSYHNVEKPVVVVLDANTGNILNGTTVGGVTYHEIFYNKTTSDGYKLSAIQAIPTAYGGGYVAVGHKTNGATGFTDMYELILNNDLSIRNENTYGISFMAANMTVYDCYEFANSVSLVYNGGMNHDGTPVTSGASLLGFMLTGARQGDNGGSGSNKSWGQMYTVFTNPTGTKLAELTTDESNQSSAFTNTFTEHTGCTYGHISDYLFNANSHWVQQSNATGSNTGKCMIVGAINFHQGAVYSEDAQTDNTGGFYESTTGFSINWPCWQVANIGPPLTAVNGTPYYWREEDEYVLQIGYALSGATWSLSLDWAKNVSHMSGQDFGYKCSIASDNGILLAGATGDKFPSTSNFLCNSADIADAMILKTDASGNLLWKKILRSDETGIQKTSPNAFGSPTVACGWSTAPTTDGGVIMCGNTNLNDDDWMLMKFTTDCQLNFGYLSPNVPLTSSITGSGGGYTTCNVPSGSTLTIDACPLTFYGEIDVYGTLNITNSTLQFNDTRLTNDFDNYTNPVRIIVHEGTSTTPGGQLNITNSTLKGVTFCASMWDGIQVWGNSSLTQSSGGQGQLTITNSTIQDAARGVKMGDDWGGHGGGIITATSTNFTNCRKGVEFFGYLDPTDNLTNPIIPNLSYFNHCVFNCTGPMIGSYYYGSGLNTHISMSSVVDVGIDDCQFINSGSTTSQLNRGIGIAVVDASFIACKTLTLGGPSGCSIDVSTYTNNTFQNLDQGIVGNAFSFTNLIPKIRFCRFYNVQQAINLNGYVYSGVMSDPNYLCSIFSNLLNWDLNYHPVTSVGSIFGINLTSCRRFNILYNGIYKDQALNNAITGIFIKDCDLSASDWTSLPKKFTFIANNNISLNSSTGSFPHTFTGTHIEGQSDNVIIDYNQFGTYYRDIDIVNTGSNYYFENGNGTAGTVNTFINYTAGLYNVYASNSIPFSYIYANTPTTCNPMQIHNVVKTMFTGGTPVLPNSSFCIEATGEGGGEDKKGVQAPVANQITSDDDGVAMFSLKIIPNPFESQASILYTIPNNDGSTYIKVNDALGRNVRTLLLSGNQGTILFDKNDLSKGIYFYNVVSNGRIYGQGKFIIAQ